MSELMVAVVAVVAAVAAVALSVGMYSLAGATEYKWAYCAETKTYCQFKTVTDYRTVTDYKVKTRYRTQTRYRTVSDYKVEKQAHLKCVTEYDHCGKPYVVKKTCYKDVKVPYQKQVACEVKVKACD